jgi:thiol-disulfide isomerase/thioredoxin
MNVFKYLFILFLFVSCSSSDKNKNTHTIEAQLSNLKTSKLLYAKLVNNKPVFFDTINVKDGKFKVRLKNQEQEDFRFLVPINNKRKFIKFFSDNSDLKIVADFEDLKNAKVIGSTENDAFVELMKDYQLIEKQSTMLKKQMQLAYMDGDVKRGTELENEMYDNESRKSDSFLEFAKKHTNSVLGAWALYQIIEYKDFTDINPVYQELSPKAKNSSYGQNLALVLEQLAKIAIGAPAPSFELITLDGQTRTLDYYKGRKVLLHFWNPTCSHCRDMNEQLAPLIEDLKSKNITIIGLVGTMDEEGFDYDFCKEIVKFDALDYEHLHDDNFIADLYRVSGIPTFILLDEKGKYLKRDLSIKDIKQLISNNIN